MLDIGRGEVVVRLPHLVGEEGGGTAEDNVHPHRGHRPDVGAGHAAVQYVADDDCLEPLQVFLMLADSIEVEERLGGVGVPAVAGVDNARLDVFSNDIGRT